MNSRAAAVAHAAAEPHAVRRCAPGDEAALALVGGASFLETFAGVLDGAAVARHCRTGHAPEVYRDWLEDGAAAVWLATAAPGGAPVGYAVLAPSRLPVASPRDDDLELKRIYLLHRFQGGGLGRRLLDAAIEEARLRGAGRLLLGVYVDNQAALPFYRRVGFAPTGDRRLFRVGERDYEDLILALDLGARTP